MLKWNFKFETKTKTKLNAKTLEKPTGAICGGW